MTTTKVDIHLKAAATQATANAFAGACAAGAATTGGSKKPEGGEGKKKGGEKPKKDSGAATTEDAGEDKLVLTNAIDGQVCTRFPPEASGFIHIGHAKAALVNSMLRDKFHGKMIFRFDDTNPDKENHEFEKAIVEDLERLGVKWDQGPTYSSDYFELMIEKCEWMIAKGTAYCDDTAKEPMQALRKAGKPSAHRDNSVEKNQAMWAEMKKGSEAGRATCVRAKISFDNVNGALRDPTMYRTKVTAHPRQGDKYVVYPTYDFCCPIVDSVEGVTHALRTNEYHDRNAQYDWFCDTLEMRKPQLEDFSRLNMEYSLMSKRKLTRCVDELKVVDGWDDPRFPTVRGLLRRGLKVDALKEFVKVQGMSKAVNFMEWSKLWNFNIQILDPSVSRYAAASADHSVTCTVIGGPKEPTAQTRLRHKKNESLGEKTYYHAPTLLMDAEDILLLKPDEEVTLMDWGNAFVKNVVNDEKGYPSTCDLVLHPEGEIKKTKWKLHWVPKMEGTVSLQLHEYDQLLKTKKYDADTQELEDVLAKNTHLTQNAIGEKALREVKVGETFQLERRGYYILDQIKPDGTLSLIAIPDGKEKLNHLSAKAQFYKEHPEHAPAPAADPKAAAAGGKKGDAKAGGGGGEAAMTLEEKRAAKAAKKAAGKKPAAEKKDDEKKVEEKKE